MIFNVDRSFLPTGLWQVSNAAHGRIETGLAAINQSIENVLLTRKGTDPFRPAFGADIQKYQDLPMQELIPLVKISIIDSLSRWEPRIQVKEISHQIYKPDGLNTYSAVVFRILYSLVGAIDVTEVYLDVQTSPDEAAGFSVRVLADEHLVPIEFDNKFIQI